MRQFLSSLVSGRLLIVLVASFSLVAALTVGLNALVVAQVVRDYLETSEAELVARDMNLAQAFYRLKLDEVASISYRLALDPWVNQGLPGAIEGQVEALRLIDQQIVNKITVLALGGTHLIAVLDADRYWWGARLDRLALPEARELLAESARAHNLLNVANVRCPLCDAEITSALAAADDGELYVRRQAACARCDFRVDACRHCAHFLPATVSFTMFDRHGDFSHGRCAQYRAPEPVRTAYPQHARRMEAMGYDVLPTPKPIADSFIPLAECAAFSLKPELLRQSKVPWLNRQRVALVRLQQKVNRSR
jgi:hypothetical protein